ncbi:MAG: hypothetical protein ACKV2Q_30770 [Planctomycetaceae bacterium]
MDKKHKADHKREEKRVKKTQEPVPGAEPTITIGYHPDTGLTDQP